jgi:predicted Zn-dependent protease
MIRTVEPTPPAAAHPSATLARQSPRSRGARVLRVARLVALYALAVVGLSAALVPITPAESSDLAAATTARAALRYDHALTWYAAAMAQAPGDPRPYCLTGEVRLLQQEWRDAADAYRACALRAPNAAGAWIGLGQAQAALHDDTGAAAAWERAVALGSDDAVRRLALLDEQQQRFDDAQRLWQRLPSDDPQARVQLGLLALRQGNIAAARADFVVALAQPNPYAQWARDQGFVLYAVQPPPGALGLERLGYLFLGANLPALALAPLQSAVRLDSQSGAAHAYLGWTLWQLAEPAARREIALGLQLAPDLSFADFAAGEVAASDGHYAQAQALFQQALLHDARNPVLWSEAGRLALLQHDYLDAELDDQNAAQLSSDPTFTLQLLRLYAEYHFGIAGGRAAEAATRAMQRFPRSERVRFQVAEVYNLLGYVTLAYYTCQQARTLDPTDPAPYVLLAKYEEDDGDYVAAALDLRTALALRPRGPEAALATALLAPIAGISV